MKFPDGIQDHQEIDPTWKNLLACIIQSANDVLMPRNITDLTPHIAKLEQLNMQRRKLYTAHEAGTL